MSIVSQILPGIFRIQSEAADGQGIVNSYLVEIAARAVLIDPAAGIDTRLVATITPLAVADILVTHVQREHIEGAANFPTASLHVPAGDEYLCEGAAHYAGMHSLWEPPWQWDERGCEPGFVGGARNERPPAMSFVVSHSLTAGTTAAGLSVIATPGHGKHAVTLLAETGGQFVAFCGDLVCGDGGMWSWADCEWDYGHQSGQRALRESARSLIARRPTLLCPAHGDPIEAPSGALEKLVARLGGVLDEPSVSLDAPIDFPEIDSPAPGFRLISEHLHQYREGNCAVLVSHDGVGLLVDDGLCKWVPLPERAQHHSDVIDGMKSALGLSRIEVVIPTHYHGDHTENIPELVAMEGTRVVSIPEAAGPLAHPENYDLACLLRWYGTARETVPIDRLASGLFKWREYTLDLFHLAGQTYYHLGVDVTIDGLRTLFVGDAFHLLYMLPDPVICYNDNEPWSRGWAYAVEAMLARTPDLLVCGHGCAVRDPIPLLEQKRAFWARMRPLFNGLNARATMREFFEPPGWAQPF